MFLFGKIRNIPWLHTCILKNVTDLDPVESNPVDPAELKYTIFPSSFFLSFVERLSSFGIQTFLHQSSGSRF